MTPSPKPAAHTPQSWTFSGSEVTPAIWVVDSETGKRICTLKADEHDLDRARLIAASPDLLTACQAIVEWHNNPRISFPLAAIDRCRAAIAKAEGK